MFILLSLLAPSPMFGRNGVIVDKLGIVLLLLLVVLIFGSVSLDNVIIVVLILFLSLFFIVITLIPFWNVMKRSSYMDAWSRPMSVGGSFNLNPLLDWSRGSDRAPVWDIRLFSLNCSRSRGRTSPGLGYIHQSHAPYKVPLGI